MRTAILKNTVTGVEVKVHATTDHPSSSYGIPVWVDDDNNAYCQVDTPTPLYEIKDERNVLSQEEYTAKLPEKCQHCAAEPICAISPERCGLNETKEMKITVTYFVMAFNVNTGKKEIRSEIVKDDKNKAIALANDWHKEFQSYANDKIEIYVTEHMEIDKEVLNLSNQDNS